MHSLLSGDFEDLLCESLEASSVKEGRGQVSGVEGHTTPSPLLTSPHIPPLPSTPSLYCTLQSTVDSTVLSDRGKGENSDP